MSVFGAGNNPWFEGSAGFFRNIVSNFDFSSISGLIGWFDPADTENRTVSSSKYDELVNKSSTSHPNLTSSGSDRPDVEKINDRDAAGFDSSIVSMNMQSSAFSSSVSQPTTIFCVVESKTLTTQTWGVFDGTSLNHKLIMRPNGGTGSSVLDAFAGGSTIPSPSGAFSNGEQFIFVVEFNGASSNLYKDNTLQNSGDAGPDALDGFTYGNFSGTGNAVGAKLGTLLVYNKIHSTSDRETIVNELKNEWGIA